MLYDLSKQEEQRNAEFYFAKLIKENALIDLSKAKRKRSVQQNKALHKFFSIISDQLNEMGLEFKYFGLKGQVLEMRYTPNIVKEYIWKPIQLALFDKESTTKITTLEINEIIDVLTKYFGERGINIEFPSIDRIIK